MLNATCLGKNIISKNLKQDNYTRFFLVALALAMTIFLIELVFAKKVTWRQNDIQRDPVFLTSKGNENWFEKSESSRNLG